MSLFSQTTNQKPFLPIGALSADRLLSERTPTPCRFFSAISRNTTSVNPEVSASDRHRSNALQRRLQRDCIVSCRRPSGLVAT